MNKEKLNKYIDIQYKKLKPILAKSKSKAEAVYNKYNVQILKSYKDKKGNFESYPLLKKGRKLLLINKNEELYVFPEITYYHLKLAQRVLQYLSNFDNFDYKQTNFADFVANCNYLKDANRCLEIFELRVNRNRKPRGKSIPMTKHTILEINKLAKKLANESPGLYIKPSKKLNKLALANTISKYLFETKDGMGTTYSANSIRLKINDKK